MPSIGVNGVDIHYESFGSGPPVVLVHGSWGDRTAWNLVTPKLAERFTVITYDRRGHAGSSGPPAEGTRADDERDLIGLVHALGIAPVNAVGSSFGASVLLGSAARDGSTFARITGHEPPLLRFANGVAPDLVTEIRSAFARVRNHLEAREHATGAEMFVEEIGIGRGVWALMPEVDREDMIGNAPTFIGEIEDPEWDDLDVEALTDYDGVVLLTQGSTSLPWFSKVLDGVSARVPSIRRTTIEGAGHVPQLTHPDALTEVILRFLTD